VLDARHVACVNGSELIDTAAAFAAPAPTSAATSATPSAAAPRRDNDRSDRLIAFSSRQGGGRLAHQSADTTRTRQALATGGVSRTSSLGEDPGDALYAPCATAE
jgi:type IV secretory pathway VirJ component